MSTNAVAVRELPEKLGPNAPKNWSVRELWNFTLDLFDAKKKEEKKSKKSQN